MIFKIIFVVLLTTTMLKAQRNVNSNDYCLKIGNYKCNSKYPQPCEAKLCSTEQSKCEVFHKYRESSYQFHKKNYKSYLEFKRALSKC